MHFPAVWRKIVDPERRNLVKSDCLICGREISSGFLCDRCDKPRKAPKAAGAAAAQPAAEPAAETAPEQPAASPAPAPAPAAAAPAPPRGEVPQPAAAPPAPPRTPITETSRPYTPPAAAAARSSMPQPAFEPFPKAPVLPFPVESTSLAITSVCDILAAANVPALLLGADRAVRFVTEDARNILGLEAEEPIPLRTVEAKLGARIGELNTEHSGFAKVNDRIVRFSVVPLAGSAGGAVLMVRPQEPFPDQTPFAAYVRETVMMPLRALHESLAAAAGSRRNEPILEDTLSTIDQILSSLELASNVEEPPRRRGKSSTISQIVQQIGDRFRADCMRRNVVLQIDMPEIPDAFRDEGRLTQSLQILLENALHYVPEGGQIVLGARMMEHKDKPLLLFFVMDNGPVVPEEYRKSIFDAGFMWDPNDRVRTGKNLARVRQFAIEHGGQVSVESKSGKACTFFLRIRPDL